MIKWARDWRASRGRWRGLESPGEGAGSCSLMWSFEVLAALFSSMNPRGSVSGGSCMVYGGMFIGAFLGRSSLGMAASGLLTVSVGG